MSDSKLRFAAKVLPRGYQIVSEEAINWLYENYPEAYQGFYERVSGLTEIAYPMEQERGDHVNISDFYTGARPVIGDMAWKKNQPKR